MNYNVLKPGPNPALRGVHCLAPYFTDLLVTNEATVYYRGYDYTEDFSQEAQNISTVVRGLVKSAYDVSITPVFIAKATWVEVPHFFKTPGEVSSFTHICDQL